MKSKIFLGLLFLTASFCIKAQVPTAAVQKSSKSSIENLKNEKKASVSNSVSIHSTDKAKNTKNHAQQANYVRPDSKTRLNRYVKSMVGPTALAKNVMGAGYGTWRNSPEEWGNNWEGFGRRVASNFGKSAISNTTRFALEEAFKLDSQFYRSDNKSFGVRLGNALISPLTARNENGKRVFGFPRIAGTYTANIIAREAWYPKRYDYKDGLRSGTISLGMNALFNVAKEFILK